MEGGPAESKLRRYHVSTFGVADEPNQSDFRPQSAWNCGPVRVTLPVEPTILTVSTRPPMSPKPLRLNTNPWNVPMPYRDESDEGMTVNDQLWLGFEPMPSPSSATTGNTPPAV